MTTWSGSSWNERHRRRPLPADVAGAAASGTSGSCGRARPSRSSATSSTTWRWRGWSSTSRSSGLALGTILIASGVPRALMMLPFGVLADRRPPRTPDAGRAHVARGVIVGAIAALVVTDAVTAPAAGGARRPVRGGGRAVHARPSRRSCRGRSRPSGCRRRTRCSRGRSSWRRSRGRRSPAPPSRSSGPGRAFAVDSVSFFAAALRRDADLDARPDADGAPASSELSRRAPRRRRADGRAGRPAPSFAAADPRRGQLRRRPTRRCGRPCCSALVLNFALNGPAAVGMPWLAEVRFDAGPTGSASWRRPGPPARSAGTLVAGNLRVRRQGAGHARRRWPSPGPPMMAVGIAQVAAGRRSSALAVMGVAIGYVEHRRHLVAAGARGDRHGRPGDEPRDADGLRDHAALPRPRGRADRRECDRPVPWRRALVLLVVAAAAAIRYPTAFDAPRSAPGQAGVAATQ